MSGILKINCKSCKQDFIWDQKEQEWYKGNGWLTPKRCKTCRNLKKKYFKAKVEYQKIIRESSINDSKFK